METDVTTNTFGLQVDNSNIPYLNEAAKWAKFLSIVGFIFSGIAIIAAIFFSSIFSSSLAGSNTDFQDIQGFKSMESIIIIIYVVIIVGLYFFPLLYLFRFGSKLQTAIHNNDQVSLNASFSNLKSGLKFLGILTIILLSIYAIAIVFAILGSAFMH